MKDDWGSTGVPEDDPKLPLLTKVRSLIRQDVALAEGSRARGFSDRQAKLGFRQPGGDLHVPEVNVGALMDLGS